MRRCLFFIVVLNTYVYIPCISNIIENMKIRFSETITNTINSLYDFQYIFLINGIFLITLLINNLIIEHMIL